MKADAVFEGGGVKGIGLVGAVAEVEKAGSRLCLFWKTTTSSVAPMAPDGVT